MRQKLGLKTVLTLLLVAFLVSDLGAQARMALTTGVVYVRQFTGTMVGETYRATTAYILGTADTSGIRLDLESGSLACREGDDSAYCDALFGSVGAATLKRQNGTTMFTFDGDTEITANVQLSGGRIQASDRFQFSGGGSIRNNGDTRIEILNQGTSAFIDLRALGFHALGPTSGIGYITGAGGTVTQATSITTGVTINKVTGQITTVTAPAIAAGAEASFTVTNSAVAATDTVLVNVATQFTDGEVFVFVKSVSAGSFVITLTNVSAAAVSAGTAVLNFTVIKGATS